MSSRIRPAATKGMAMMFVLALSVVILALGMSMIGLSGTVLGTSADTKARVRARYAAESAISAAIADAVFQAGEIFGGGIGASHRDVESDNDDGAVDVSSGSNLGQEVILQKRSPMNQLRGNKIPLKMEALGKAGQARSKIIATVALYQVPIYQFGVFYEGPLEITPGPDMFVMGRVHTNDTAYFRGAGALKFQGPVTVVGNIYQWVRGTGTIGYQTKPDTSEIFTPALSPTNSGLAAMTSGTQPPDRGGTRNVRYHETRLTLPIGVGTPRSILGVASSSDPAALRRQKFDWLVKNPARCSPNARFVYGGAATTVPPWIKGPYAFYDRREMTWVKVWDFDVRYLKDSAASVNDSIFYLDDTTTTTWHVPGSTRQTLNAFRIVNASVLPRNMTIACGKPVYIQGDFNRTNASGDTTLYKNAQIASDAITVLSANWPSWKASNISGTFSASASSMERPFADTNWVYCGTYSSSCVAAQSVSMTGNGPSADVRINAAMITGNRQSRPSCLVAGTSETTFDGCYEGGWHNTLRFLENWSGRTVVFKGSFVCMWQAATAGLSNPGSGRVYGGPYYSPPTRIWGYDKRFDNLANMPPGAPFLATAILTNWLERN